ncbi:Serine/threonine-protein kinase Nek2 [Orbilia oligospora]|uniref:non-specific serine/threonine protein kinase n=1 Tax=Orbilia oligospora TaxID=2813651 RepID=A0A7C8QQK6_ORBOL|nr:Serine/threonine-protein kinase Nek2 [Orbilia oligospora]
MFLWRSKPTVEAEAAAPAPAPVAPLITTSPISASPSPARPVISANSISVTFSSSDFSIIKGTLGRIDDRTKNADSQKAGPRKLKGKDTDYEYIQHLGQGSYGNVSKVRRAKDGKIMACKTIDCARNPQLYDFTCREVDIWSSFKNEKYIAQYAQDYSWNPSTKSMRLYMDFYEGGDLQKVLEACRADEVAIHPLVATYWATEIARGLKNCHERGVVHKDLKPSNVLLSMPYVYNDMLWTATLGENLTEKEKQLASQFTQWLKTRSPWCHISDFGVGKNSKGGLNGESPVSLSTETTYVPPECADSAAKYTTKSNVFSLGRILYALCQCDLPVDTPLEDIQPLPVEYPERLRALIPRCLKADPAERPTASEVVLELMESLVDFCCDNQFLKLKSNIDRQINPTRPIARTRTLSSASTLANVYTALNGAVTDSTTTERPTSPAVLSISDVDPISRTGTPSQEPRKSTSSPTVKHVSLAVIPEQASPTAGPSAPAPPPAKAAEDLREDLVKAWHSRDINAMERALVAGADANTVARSWPKIGITTEYPLLNWTIKDGWSKMMRLLVTHGATFDAPISDIVTKLSTQTEVKSFQNQYHPIYLAVFIADFGILDFFFVEKGYNVNSQHLERGDTPLHIAVMRQDLRVVKYLLQKGASTEFRNEFGESGVHQAARSWGTKVNPCLEYLLEVFPDGVNEVDASGNTPLHIAAKDGCLEGIKVLLRKGAKTTVRNEEGNTPEMLAIGRQSIAQALREAEGLIPIKEKDEFTPEMSVGVMPVMSAMAAPGVVA